MGRGMVHQNIYIFWAFIVLLLGGAGGAGALEAGIEEAYAKIIINSFDGEPAPDPNTHDGDDNGIVDRAQFRLLDTVLRLEDAPHHDEVLAVYLANLAQMEDDNTLGAIKCKFMEILYHFTCGDFNRHGAGTLTLAEPVAVARMVYEYANGSGINLDLDEYNLTLAAFFNGAGDLDGDGATNADEFASVCGNFDAYVSAAMDPAQTPDTVPCCGVCILALTAQPQGGQRYAHDSHSFFVAVDDSEGEVHYQWYKGGEAVGPDAPEFALPDLAVSDSGTYWCVVTDASETVTSDMAALVVVNPMEITEQPEGGAYYVGELHAFSVAVDGGLGTVHYQWFKDEAQLGPDAPDLILTALTEADAGVYWCVVSDDTDYITSTMVELVVAAHMEIVQQPQGADRMLGESHTFTVEVSGGLGTLHYQWFKDETPLGPDASEFVLDSLTETDAGSYWCVVSDAREQVSTEHVELQVTVPVEGEGDEEGAPSEGSLEEGQAEGLMEGEGGSEGIVEGLLEGEEEGQGEGIEEGAVEEGPREGMLEGEGVEEGVVEGLIEGSLEGEAEGPIEGTLEGSLEGQAEGGEEGIEEGVVEGQMEGEGGEEGHAEGLTEGEGGSEGSMEGDLEGQIEGAEEGALEGQAEGQAEGLNEGEGEGLTEGQSEGEGGGEGEGEGQAEGILVTSPGDGEDLSFGMVVVKKSETETVLVENQGVGTLAVEAQLEKGSQIALEGEAQFLLAAGQSADLTVRFTPGRGGQYTDRLFIHAGNQKIVITVHGQGIYVPLMSCHGEFMNPMSTLWSDLWIMLFLGMALVIWSRIRVHRRMPK